MTIALLGAGMVGHAMALDLAASHTVTAFDASADKLAALQQKNPAIRTMQADLRQTDNYRDWLTPFDLVITAVPGFMGYATLQATIAAGKHVADISFFPENALTLDALARQHGVTVITDCGVAPGMSNLVLGRYNALMKIDSFACYVGGLPQHPQPPFYYKAPFSPIDVIEEYTRPARLVQNGQVVTLPALTDRELMQVEGAGTLEAFNTDGLRSLLYTMSHIPDMKEKTWRYPGHLDLVIALQEAGFFSTAPVTVNGLPVRPLDMAVSLLLPQWKLQPGEPELTVMQIIIKGEGKIIRYGLLDHYDAATGISSMARTTGYTCTAAAELILQGLFTEKGVYPPELVGNREACFEFVLSYLGERGVRWKVSNE
ncbi:MAG TPA: saccharopine dehydrogenase C-terminal domain-containing protein [Chitinophagaceae bacterium]|nr:saccharopine dehydrogenase C-terminal domain-containing protein [Chitinophagaceae bacterium]